MLTDAEIVELETLLTLKKSDVLRGSVFQFLCEFWDVVIADELQLNWHIKFLCDEIQEILEGVIRGEEFNDDLVCNICPGTTKSTILIMAQAWLWTRKPDAVILSNTISNKNATEFSQKFRDIVIGEKYNLYFPEIKLRRDSTALTQIKNTYGGARRQYTTKSKITGDHGHVRFDDDPMAFQDARSDAEAARCIEGYKAYSTREKKSAKVPYILFMQRLSDIDTSSYVFKVKPDIKKIVLPAWDNGKVFPPELKEKYANGYLNEKHINKKFLEDKKLQLGDLQYMAEYGQDTESAEGFMYHVKRVDNMERKGLSIAVADPKDDGKCFYACVFADIHSNAVWIHDIIYNQDNSNEIIDDSGNVLKKGTILTTAEKAKQHRVTTLYIEKDGIGNFYGKQVKSKFPFVHPFNADGNKDLRIHGKAEIVSRFFRFHSQSPSIDYENAVNSVLKFKKEGGNEFKDIQDALTSMADLVVRQNLINIYK